MSNTANFAYQITCNGEPFGGAATIDQAVERVRMYRGPAGRPKWSLTRAHTSHWRVLQGTNEVAAFAPMTAPSTK